MDSRRHDPLKSDPHIAKAKGRAAGNRSKCCSPRTTTFITRLPRGGTSPLKDTPFLIHGSAIKNHAKQPKISHMQNSNRR